jgi:DHA2 family metal-tetracycline-proton antiporter-like MFS transporter
MLGLLVVVSVANNNSASLAQPSIAADLGGGPGDVGWVVFGYSAAFAVATALWGGLSRRLGLGPSLAAGVVLLSLGGLLAVMAPSLPALVGARMVQGLGSGALPTLSVALLARRFSGPERAAAFGVTVAGVAVGLAIGPIIGGLALELGGWRAAVGFGMLALPAAPFLYPLERTGDPTRRIDAVGALLTALAVLGGIFLVNRLPILGVVPLTAAMAGALALVVLLLARHVHGHPDGFLPRRVLRSAAWRRSSLLGAVGMSAFLGSFVLIPVAASSLYGLTGIGLAAILLPVALVTAVASLRNARFTARLGRRRTTALSLIMLSLGPALIALVGSGAPGPVLAACVLPLGVGFGLLSPPLLADVTAEFSEADQPIAVGTFNVVFFFGGAVGAAISTAIVQQGYALDIFAAWPLPAYTTAELLLCVAPLVAAIAAMRRSGGPGSRPTG